MWNSSYEVHEGDEKAREKLHAVLRNSWRGAGQPVRFPNSGLATIAAESKDSLVLRCNQTEKEAR